MMQLVVFVLALVAVFAINAAIALRTRDDIVANSEAFSWMSATQDDADAAARAAAEPEPVRIAPVVSTPNRRTAHVGI